MEAGLHHRRVPDKEERENYLQHTPGVPGASHNMPRAGVRGELRAYFLAAEFVKVCRLLAGDKTPRARLCYDKQGEFFCTLVEVCSSCYESSSEVSYYLCVELCR